MSAELFTASFGGLHIHSDILSQYAKLLDYWAYHCEMTSYVRAVLSSPSTSLSYYRTTLKAYHS